MASITIRNLDDSIKAKLRLQAAKHGLSMEQETREILSLAVNEPKPETSFLSRIRQHFAGLDIDELPIPPRQAQRMPPSFEE